jgi:putative inorganic carbon (HCO3(-)) transporter
VELPFDTRRIPYYLAWMAAIAPLWSITALAIALGLASLALIVAHLRGQASLRFPPVKLPLAMLFLWTLASIAFSGHAAEGWEGIRKFYLFLALLLITGAFRTRAEVRSLAWGMAGVTLLSAAWSLVQFAGKYQAARAAGVDFRLAYTAGDRITGFMSHWMTLSGEEMIVLLWIGAFSLWGASRRQRWVLAIAATVIAISLAAGYTRSMWMGTALGAVYLLWHKDRRWLLAVPLAAGLLLVWNPAGIGGRIVSIWKPAGTVDSNLFRVICRRTAMEMIRTHPWFGVGPGQVRPQFERYIPADIARPLPPGAYIHMHNTYLQFAAERGLPALAALLWLLGKMLTDLWLAARRHPEDWALRGAIAVTIAVLAAGWYEHNLGNGAVLPLFLTVAGCGYVARDYNVELAEAKSKCP